MGLYQVQKHLLKKIYFNSIKIARDSIIWIAAPPPPPPPHLSHTLSPLHAVTEILLQAGASKNTELPLFLLKGYSIFPGGAICQYFSSLWRKLNSRWVHLRGWRLRLVFSLHSQDSLCFRCIILIILGSGHPCRSLLTRRKFHVGVSKPRRPEATVPAQCHVPKSWMSFREMSHFSYLQLQSHGSEIFFSQRGV